MLTRIANKRKRQQIEIKIANVFKQVPYKGFKSFYNSIIPLKIYQTWNTKNLPPKMRERVESLKAQNPRFEHFLFDDNDCREFIRTNFEKYVLDAYDRLIPGAYKADLWRYCILYKYGGIYLDIKYVPDNNFKFVNLLTKEHFVLDQDNEGIYNAFMVCKAGNEILLKAINQIVENVKNKFYGNSFLEPTGPKLLSKYFTHQEKMALDMKHGLRASGTEDSKKYISYNNIDVVKCYSGYHNERSKYSEKKHYSQLWNERNVYL